MSIIASAISGAISSGNAADAQVDAVKEANKGNSANLDKTLAFYREALNKGIQYQDKSYARQDALQKPYRDIGLRSQNKLQSMMGLGGLGSQEGYRYQDYVGKDKNAQAAARLKAQMDALGKQYGSAPKAFVAGDRNALINKDANSRWWYGTEGGKAELAQWDAGQAKGKAGYAKSKAAYDAAQKQKAALQAQYGKYDALGKKGYGQWLGKQKAPADYGSLMKDFSMQDFHNDPGYAFRKQQGEMGLDRAAAASGRVGSGRYMKDAMQFNQGLADQSYGDAYNRFQTNRANKMNALQSLGGVGQTSANTLTDGARNWGNQNQAGWQNFSNNAGQAQQNYGSMLNENTLSAGNARASGYIGQGNAIAGGIGNAMTLGAAFLGGR
jgi:hypothetical protein